MFLLSFGWMFVVVAQEGNNRLGVYLLYDAIETNPDRFFYLDRWFNTCAFCQLRILSVYSSRHSQCAFFASFISLSDSFGRIVGGVRSHAQFWLRIEYVTMNTANVHTLRTNTCIDDNSGNAYIVELHALSAIKPKQIYCERDKRGTHKNEAQMRWMFASMVKSIPQCQSTKV